MYIFLFLEIKFKFMGTTNSTNLVKLLFEVEGNLNDERYEIETVVDSENSTIEKIVKIQGARIIDEANVFLHYYDHQ